MGGLVRLLGGQSRHSQPMQPLSLFPAIEEKTFGPSNSGGWDCCHDVDAVPAEWLPSVGAVAAIDSIDASQFDWNVFESHYVRHRRPLLVRGGAKMDVSVA